MSFGPQWVVSGSGEPQGSLNAAKLPAPHDTEPRPVPPLPQGPLATLGQAQAAEVFQTHHVEHRWSGPIAPWRARLSVGTGCRWGRGGLRALPRLLAPVEFLRAVALISPWLKLTNSPSALVRISYSTSLAILLLLD